MGMRPPTGYTRQSQAESRYFEEIEGAQFGACHLGGTFKAEDIRSRGLGEYGVEPGKPYLKDTREIQARHAQL